ncbi:hypothetical protein SSS_08918 [Sarcoptes scabiei]|nr:hypothetical protein SSS_08918 [Sarcoptes scabiei]
MDRFLLSFLIWQLCNIIILLLKIVDSDEEVGASMHLWTPEDYPSLIVETEYCNRNVLNLSTSICDPDGILNLDEDRLISFGQNSSVCLCPPCRNSSEYGLMMKIGLLRSMRYQHRTKC